MVPESVRLAARFEGGYWAGQLRVRDRVVDLAALRSVWYRSPGTFGLPAEMSAVERHWAMTEAKMGLGGVLSALPLTWVNHPARIADASVKPVQLAVAAGCGLSVPDTVVTNDDAAVRSFATAGATVAKALGAPSIVEPGGRATAFTQRLDDTDLADLRGVELTTHQFQRWVPKAWEARVIVAGQRLFTAGIHAGTHETHVDWRNSYADLAYSRPELPDDVAEGLLRYCACLGLSYAAVDFAITPDGEWVFLEANPGGQFGWIADAIGAPITTAIADLLTDPAGRSTLNRRPGRPRGTGRPPG
ncbi:MAG: RimK domain-containing protein [Actinomycetota bacterium]|nr:RimK domain-containing protein [Actinomycetota bacterium]